MAGRLRQWLEIRIGLDDLIRSQLTEYRVPRNINMFYTLGFVALAAFAVQVITGFFLLIYYVPHADHAFESVQNIMNRIPYGWLVRLMHVVGSNLMVAVVFLHMISVFFMGSYKKPRELTWVAGALMLLVVLTFCLSGYLLPWSQLSYWATTIVTSIPTAFPYIGDVIATMLRGSENVSGVTLNRFFAIHVALLPLLLLLLLGIHIFLVRRIGISSPPFGTSGEESTPWTEFRHDSHPRGHSFYPYFVQKEMLMVMVYFVVMFGIIALKPSLFLPGDANVPADPLKTPFHIKPEWYFLSPYQMLKLVPNKFLGIMLQLFFTAVFVLWPFLDRGREDHIGKRPAVLILFFGALATWIILTLWGMFS